MLKMVDKKPEDKVKTEEKPKGILGKLKEAADEFGDVEFIGYLGGSYDKFYGELSAATNEDLVDWGAKAGVKFTF